MGTFAFRRQFPISKKAACLKFANRRMGNGICLQYKNPKCLQTALRSLRALGLTSRSQISSLGNLWSCKEGERTKPPWAPGLSAVGKIAELEQVLGAWAAQDWAPSQTAFQVAVKTCRYCSNRARGVCWHCRGSVELVQSQEACSRSSEYLFLPELPAAPVKLLAIPCCKKSLQSCPASETPCGKAKPQGLQPCLGQRNRSAPQIRL